MRNVREISTSTLRAMDRWFDGVPLFVLANLRADIKRELLARELQALADESGGYLSVTVGDWN